MPKPTKKYKSMKPLKRVGVGGKKRYSLIPPAEEVRRQGLSSSRRRKNTTRGR